MVVDAARRRCGILSSNSSHNLSWQQHLALALSVSVGSMVSRTGTAIAAGVERDEARPSPLLDAPPLRDVPPQLPTLVLLMPPGAACAATNASHIKASFRLSTASAIDGNALMVASIAGSSLAPMPQSRMVRCRKSDICSR